MLVSAVFWTVRNNYFVNKILTIVLNSLYNNYVLTVQAAVSPILSNKSLYCGSCIFVLLFDWFGSLRRFLLSEFCKKRLISSSFGIF